MNYDKDIKWIKEANRAAKPRWSANNEPADDEPCCWCNDQGPDTDDGESHPCALCGAMS